jgi:xanthine dehydrogenase accessory factor
VPPRRRLLIVGAGHVGLALARLASFAGCAVSVVDERLEMVSKERFPMAEALYSGSDLIEALKKVPADPDAAVVIATHADDERALRAMLQRTWSYCGMLGSRRKVKILFEKLGGEGTDPELLAKVRAPIGLDIGAETPEEIAISILAEIFADDTSTSCNHLAEAPRS